MPTITGYIQAKHYRYGTRRKTMVVIHCMQAPQTNGRAKGVAGYFATTNRAASTQFCVDNREVWQSLRIDSQTPFGAGFGSNADGLHIEQPGFAEYNRDQWLTPYGHDTLRVLAKLVAELCKEHGIPHRILSVADLKAGNRSGITFHKTLSDAAGGGHWDPGHSWPTDVFMRYLAEASGGPTPIRLGGNNDPEAVKRIQKFLQGVGLYDGDIDGIYGPVTNHGAHIWKHCYMDIKDGNGDWTMDTIIKTVQWGQFLEAVAEQTKKPPFKVLEVGAENNPGHVSSVQNTLRGLKLWDGDNEGVYDQSVADAAKKWQEFLSLPQTGKWDEETARATWAWVRYMNAAGE